MKQGKALQRKVIEHNLNHSVGNGALDLCSAKPPAVSSAWYIAVDEVGDGRSWSHCSCGAEGLGSESEGGMDVLAGRGERCGEGRVKESKGRVRVGEGQRKLD